MDIDLLPNSSGVLPASLTQHKHIPIDPRSNDLNRPQRSRRYAVRAAAKRYAHGSGRYLCKDLGFVCPNRLGSETLCARCGDPNPVTRRVRVENDLRANAVLCAIRDRTPRTRSRWIDDKSEGCDLARSAVPLPSDRFRLVRTPSLEREDAFRDAATAKRLRRSPPATLSGEDADVAELYRMGLLYDDEQDRGEGFDLNSIEHQEPVYSVRPAKRSRKSKARGWDDLDHLHLNLSFTDLGGDQTIAQFLSPTDDPDPTAAGESSSSSSSRTSRIFAPLRVIYELDGSQPDVDVDTSQPPDLVSDILSDYDYFSDSDLDDLPSQREVRDSAAAPASDAWVVLGDDS